MNKRHKCNEQEIRIRALYRSWESENTREFTGYNFNKSSILGRCIQYKEFQALYDISVGQLFYFEDLSVHGVMRAYRNGKR